MTVTRVTHGHMPADVTQHQPESSRAYERGPFHQRTPFSSKKGDSVMSTLQHVKGKATVELVPGVHGSRTEIRQAIASGLVIQTGATAWIDNPNPNKGNQQ
jgi:hypothetical protein